MREKRADGCLTVLVLLLAAVVALMVFPMFEFMLSRPAFREHVCGDRPYSWTLACRNPEAWAKVMAEKRQR